MPIKAFFSAGVDTLTVSGLHQWDYGQKLEIHGLALPALIEVHFACLNMTEAHVRIGTTADGVTTVAIPDSCLEHDTPLRAWVYVIDTVSGRTEKTIMLPIVARTKPQGADSRQPFVVDEYKEAIDQINKTVDGWRDGIVCQNGGEKIKFWEGTRAEFNALEETDPDTLYVIIDELPDYTELVRKYEELDKKMQDVPAELGEQLQEMGEYLQQVQDGEVSVPKAGQAFYDKNGRNLDKMGYFGNTFQKITKLTEEGVYQIIVDDGLQQFCFPLVVVGGLDTSHRTERLFPGPYNTVLTLYSDGSFGVRQTSTAGTDTSLDEPFTVYARKVSSISGW